VKPFRLRQSKRLQDISVQKMKEAVSGETASFYVLSIGNTNALGFLYIAFFQQTLPHAEEHFSRLHFLRSLHIPFA
jgi:hypothetical protein